MTRLFRIWKNYNLSLVLGALFLLSWAAQFVMQIKKVKNDAASKGESFRWSTFWPEFWTSTLENWQSEFLQLLTFVILTSFLIHKHSAESRDSGDRLEAKMDRILSLIERN
jgi:hypothetical protein